MIDDWYVLYLDHVVIMLDITVTEGTQVVLFTLNTFIPFSFPLHFMDYIIIQPVSNNRIHSTSIATDNKRTDNFDQGVF